MPRLMKYLLCLSMATACGKNDHGDRQRLEDEYARVKDERDAALKDKDKASAEALALKDSDSKAADQHGKDLAAVKKAEADAQAAAAHADLVAKDNAALNDKLLALAAKDASIDPTMAAFAGIWLAEDDPALELPDGCKLVVRVSTKPALLTQVVACANGQLESAVAPVVQIRTEPSLFAAGIQLKAVLGASTSSCRGREHSRFGRQHSVAFDLSTRSGGEAATHAYSKVNSIDTTYDSYRSKDCPAIVAAAAATTAQGDLKLQLAAKACTIETQTVGCNTASGFVSHPSP